MKKCSEVTTDTARCGKDVCCKFCDTRNECEYPCEANQKTCPACYEDGEPVGGGLTPLDAFKSKAMTAIKQVAELELAKKDIETREADFREQLLQAMEQYSIKKFETPEVTFTYVAPTTRNTIDSKALKAEQPEIAAMYTKTSSVKASVKITVKDGKE